MILKENNIRKKKNLNWLCLKSAIKWMEEGQTLPDFQDYIIH